MSARFHFQRDRAGLTVVINALEQHNQGRRREIEAVRDRQRAVHAQRRPSSLEAYPLPALTQRIAEALSDRWGQGGLEPHVELIERERLGADLALRFPLLLRDGGPKGFIQKHLPWIVEVLSGAAFSDAIARLEVKGMYINLTLSDRWLLQAAQAVVDAGSGFGGGDALCARTYVVDYSSPNVAKRLHAGHIRSTIIGHVLGDLYEACGALVYRVNHINDFGGFGFTLEGYRRFAQGLAQFADPNDRLIEIYRIRRTAERVLAAKGPWAALEAEDRALFASYFPQADSLEMLGRAFADYTTASDARFAALEAGEPQDVALWRQMVDWSLADFDSFYRDLNISFDLVIGESFYLQAGDEAIDWFLASGKALRYSPEDAATAVAELDARVERGEITSVERDNLAALAEKDVGAVVIPLDRGERFVVRRADGRSIYATRDIGAVALRRELFDPSDMVYVVGQEQQVHFDRLFRASYATGLAPEALRFQHIYFGFYVDAQTGKKLSSRDSVAGVTELLSESVRYFRSRISDRGEFSAQELESAAQELAVGSLVFNDLKQDVKGAVDVAVSDMAATIAGFERSGAAYVVYAACRARSILRRHGREPTPASEIEDYPFDAQEALLMMKLQQTPQKIAVAAQQSNPSLLVRHMLEVATLYNSYYTRAPVIVGGVANPARLLITAAIQHVLINGLALCHVTCPAVI